MLKVMHSFPVWLPQTQTWMYNQIKYMPAHQVESHVICERMENLDQFNLPNIHCMEGAVVRYFIDRIIRKMKITRYLPNSLRILRKEGVDILHSHFGPIGWVDIKLAKKMGLKHVVTFYGLDVNYLPRQDSRWLRRYGELFDSVDRILCEGPHMANCIVELGCPKEKVIVHHLGVEVDKIPFIPRQWHPGETLRVLIAATFREKKGIPYALEALGMLQRKVPLHITLIGDATPEARSQEEKRRIFNMIEKYQLQNKIDMLGFQPHKRLFEEAYKHHVFFSPSLTASDGDTEGGAPVSIIEMSATGMPVISTKHADIPEILSSQSSSLLTEEKNAFLLFMDLQKLLFDMKSWSNLLIVQRKHIEKEYNVLFQGRSLFKLYESL